MNVQVEEIESKTLNNHFGKEPAVPKNGEIVELPKNGETVELPPIEKEEQKDEVFQEEEKCPEPIQEEDQKIPLFGHKKKTQTSNKYLMYLMGAALAAKILLPK